MCEYTPTYSNVSQYVFAHTAICAYIQVYNNISEYISAHEAICDTFPVFKYFDSPWYLSIWSPLLQQTIRLVGYLAKKSEVDGDGLWRGADVTNTYVYRDIF